MKKTAAESHRILLEAYGEPALSERMCQKWFARFKSGDFGHTKRKKKLQTHLELTIK